MPVRFLDAAPAESGAVKGLRFLDAPAPVTPAIGGVRFLDGGPDMQPDAQVDSPLDALSELWDALPEAASSRYESIDNYTRQEPAFANLPGNWMKKHHQAKERGEDHLSEFKHYYRFREQLKESTRGERPGFSWEGEEWRTGRASINLYREAAELAAKRDALPKDSPEYGELSKQLQIKDLDIELAEKKAQESLALRLEAGLSEGEQYDIERAKQSRIEQLPPGVRQVVRGVISADLKIAELVGAGLGLITPESWGAKEATEGVRDMRAKRADLGAATRRGYSWLGQQADQAGESVAEFATVSLTAGSGAVLPYLASTATRDGYTEALDMGYSGKQALAIGAARGTWETAVTYLTGKVLGGGVENPGKASWLSKWLRPKLANAAAPIATAANIASQAGAEGLEELIVELGHAAIDGVAGIERQERLGERLTNAGVLGLLGGSMASTVHTGVEAARQTTQEIFGIADQASDLPSDEMRRGFLAGTDWEGEVPGTSRREFEAATGEKQTSAEYRQGFAMGATIRAEAEGGQGQEVGAAVEGVLGEQPAVEPPVETPAEPAVAPPIDPAEEAREARRKIHLTKRLTRRIDSFEAETQQPETAEWLRSLAAENPDDVSDIFAYAKQLRDEQVEQVREYRYGLLEALGLTREGLAALRNEVRAKERQGGDASQVKHFDEILAVVRERYPHFLGADEDTESALRQLLLKPADQLYGEVPRWEFLGRAIEEYEQGKAAEPLDPAEGGEYDQVDAGNWVPVFHGTPVKLDGLPSVKHFKDGEAAGVYFSGDKDAAMRWGKTARFPPSEDTQVHELEIRLDNPASHADKQRAIKELEKQFGEDWTPQQLTDLLKSQGFDGVIDDTYIGNEYIVFDDSQIRKAGTKGRTLSDDRTGRRPAPRPKPKPGPSAATGEYLSTPARNVDVPGFPLKTLVGVPANELIRMIQELGVKIRVSDLPSGVRGSAYTAAGEAGTINISRELGKNHSQFKKTLPHEIGHILDAMPDGVIDHGGNVLSRMAGLKGFKHSLLRNSPGGKMVSKDVIRQELEDVSFWWRPFDEEASTPAHTEYRKEGKELYADAISVFLNAPGELQSRAPRFFEGLLGYIKNKPDIAKAYVEYQSLLQGNPAEVTKARLATLEAGFDQGDKIIVAAMEAERLARQSVKEALVQDGAAKAWDLLWDTYRPAAQSLLLNRSAAVIATQQRAGRKDPLSSEPFNAFRLTDQLNRVDAKAMGWLNRFAEVVHKPLVAAGLTENDLGYYLFLRRIIGEPDGETGRSQILNPHGYLPETASPDMEQFAEQLGPEKFAILKEQADQFHDMVFSAVEEAYMQGLITTELFEEVIVPNRHNYAAFGVLQYLDSKVPWAMHEAKGTFEAVANPYRTTIMKMVTMLRAARINELKRQLLLGQLRRDDSKKLFRVVDRKEVEQRKRWNEKRRAKGKPELEEKYPGWEGQLAFSEDQPRLDFERVKLIRDGQTEEYEVPNYYAQLFHPREHWGLGMTTQFLNSFTYGVFYPLFITYSPAFAIGNAFRDPVRTWQLLATQIGAERNKQMQRMQERGATRKEAAKRAVPRLTVAELARGYLANIKHANRRARGQFDSKINMLIESGMLDAPFTSRSRHESRGFLEDATLRKTMKEVGAYPQGKLHAMADSAEQLMTKVLPSWLIKLGRMVGRVGYTITPPYLIDFTENLGKLAAFDAMERRGFSDDQTAYMLHNMVGTPNTKYKGALSDAENFGSMFFTVRMANLRAHLQVMRANPKGYAGRMSVSIVPAMLVAWAAREGLFGESLAYLWSLIPEDEEDNHFVMPLMVKNDEDGRDKLVYLSIPRDQTDAFANTLLRRIFKASIASGEIDKGELLVDLKNETLGSWSPPIEIGWRWFDYGSDKMPEDSYFRRPIMSKAEFDAGGLPGFRKMTSWTLSKFGAVGELTKPVAGKVLGSPYEEGTDTDLENSLRSIPYLSRILRISDRAIDNDVWERAREADRSSSVVTTMIDPASKKAAALYSQRTGIPAAKRTENDLREIAMTSHWYNNIYRPYRQRMRVELDMGQRGEAEKYAAQLHEVTGLFETYWAAVRKGDDAAAVKASEAIEKWRPGGATP